MTGELARKASEPQYFEGLGKGSVKDETEHYPIDGKFIAASWLCTDNVPPTDHLPLAQILIRDQIAHHFHLAVTWAVTTPRQALYSKSRPQSRS